MNLQSILFVIDLLLLNLGILLSFLIRYGIPFPEYNFKPYKEIWMFLTLIYLLPLFFYGTYKKRFKSSWELFKRIFSGIFCGTLLSVAFIYVFRSEWGGFPTSIFVISFFINLLLIFKLNQLILKAKKKIRKKIVVIGESDVDDIMIKKADIERSRVEQIEELIKYKDIDEIVICEKIQSEKDLNLLTYLLQKLKIDVVFSPSIYMELLPGRINNESPVYFLSTFIGQKPDVEEFLIRGLDILGSLVVLFVSAPLAILISLWIKITSAGSVLYKQQRVGKDGKIFTLYKFRTMIRDAERTIGPVWASKDDSRITKIGKILRTTRLDELPQLFNVLWGQMSLVGPRPERPHFVKQHKALREIRLAVKPGITGLAQIRNFYDLKPQHKIKYDYLYIQQRSLLLNLYILLKTIPVVLLKKGW